jgi:HJR/Mrr/RecB family endonuclease
MSKKKVKTGSPPAITVRPIHFEDFDGFEFEHLVFAYHARTDRWISLEWFGQQGSDKGRDIIGIAETDGSPGTKTTCVLCANWRRLTIAKVKSDINKAIKGHSNGIDRFRIISGNDISAQLRDKAKEYAKTKGVHECDVWSGKEFEEFIRANAESLLKRFVEGVAFPDSANDLLMLAWGLVPTDDHERFALLSQAFDRPAFSTPIHMESSLPAFRKAIEDSIRVLNTGVWQTREGIVIRKLPNKRDFESTTVRRILTETASHLVDLRGVFDACLRSGEISPCQCADEDCPTFMMSPDASMKLTNAREAVLSKLAEVQRLLEVETP